jgi:hypothetical protein
LGVPVQLGLHSKILSQNNNNDQQFSKLRKDLSYIFKKFPATEKTTFRHHSKAARRGKQKDQDQLWMPVSNRALTSMHKARGPIPCTRKEGWEEGKEGGREKERESEGGREREKIFKKERNQRLYIEKTKLHQLLVSKRLSRKANRFYPLTGFSASTVPPL